MGIFLSQPYTHMVTKFIHVTGGLTRQDTEDGDGTLLCHEAHASESSCQRELSKCQQTEAKMCP